MDPVLVLVIGAAAVVVGFTSRTLRPLIAAGGGMIAGIGAIKATFAAISGEPVMVALWAVVAVVGAALLVGALRHAARRRAAA